MYEIGFRAREDWTVADLQQFFHQLNILYNRLHVVEEFRVEQKGKLESYLDNSLSRVPESDVLRVKSLEINSPADFNFLGVDKVISQIRKLIKDVSYKNQIAKRQHEEELRHASKMNQLEENYRQIEVMNGYIELMKHVGMDEPEIQNCLKKLIDPTEKVLSIMKAKGVEVAEESDT